MNIIRLVYLLSFAVLWNSVVNASADEVSDEGFRLIKSAVCDPPLMHSDDPLGLRDDGDSERYSKVPAAFEIALGFEFKTSKLVDAQIKGSLDEELRLISASDNEISLSAPNPKTIHALRLSQEADGIWASIHLVDDLVLRTKCYKTGAELF